MTTESPRGNWVGEAAPSSDVGTTREFDGSTRLAPNANAARTIGGITFKTGASGFTLTGADLTLASGGFVTNNSSVTQTITNSSILLPGASTWNAASGDLNVSSSITGNVVFFDVSSSVLKTGAGTLTLSGSNNYGQGATVKSGTLHVTAVGSVDNSQTTVTIGETSSKGIPRMPRGFSSPQPRSPSVC